MLKLIVFDCDGVMFDSRMANQAFYNHLLDHFNHPPMSGDELEYVHMHNVSHSISHIFRHYPDANFEKIDELREQTGYTPFLPYMKMEGDLVEFLELIKPRYHLAISTNRSNTMVPLLKSYNIENYFGKVMTSANAKRAKPAPDGLIEILDFYGCTSSETIFIGDSIIDRQHTHACNVSLIAFKNPSLPAEFHVSSFLEILDLPPFQDEN